MTLPPLRGGSTRRSASGFPQQLTHYGKLSCTFTSRSALTLKSVPHLSPRLRRGLPTDESPFPDVWLPHNGISNEERPTSGLPDPTVQHLQVFSTSWRFTPFVPLRSYFIPQPFLAFAYRGFPSPVTLPALRQSVPAMPFCPAFCSLQPKFPLAFDWSRLRGCTHPMSPLSRPCCYTQTATRSSLDLLFSKVFSPQDLSCASTSLHS